MTTETQEQTQGQIQNQIQSHVTDNPIFLYLKGTPEAPACGFSHEVVMALSQLDAKYGSFNVLENNDVRQGIKEFADWPFIPQLYIDGKFIGGRDIVMELYKKGELKDLVANAQQKPH